MILEEGVIAPAILELVTRNGTRFQVAQRYVPEIRDGDKRIILVEGEPVGAVLRVPEHYTPGVPELRITQDIDKEGEARTLDLTPLAFEALEIPEIINFFLWDVEYFIQRRQRLGSHPIRQWC